ncbi:hypothetical protein EDC04DRAFT_2610904 [Pisolithus marmoratus]|nr:hypothetical protein EDC04DRAFT_2610904 [Pisolithus marmoratus]
MNGGAATLCSKIELETMDYQVNHVSKELQQTMLLEKRKHPNKVAVTHTWPDGLTNDQPVMKVFNLDTELAHHNYTILWESQWSQLQRVINCVETQCITWDDTTNTVSIRDRPPLAPDVQQALEDLVKALNMNAYVQQCGLQVGDSDPKKCRSGIDALEVVYHVTEEGASKAFLQKCKFVVTSRYELEMSKVGTLNPADSMSVPDASEPHHAEPASTERATITDASTTHQSSENRYNILAGATGAEADHPSGNTDTQDCLMGDQETGKVSTQDADVPMETSGGKGDDAMDNAGDMSMDKSLDMGSNSSDASSDAGDQHQLALWMALTLCTHFWFQGKSTSHLDDASSAPPQISIPSPPPTAGARPPDPPALCDSDVGLAPLCHAPPHSKQKLDGGAPLSGLLNVAEGDEDVGKQLG